MEKTLHGHLLLVKEVNKVPTSVDAVDGQMVALVLKVMLLVQVVEVSLESLLLKTPIIGQEELHLLLLVLVVAVVTNQEVPVED